MPARTPFAYEHILCSSAHTHGDDENLLINQNAWSMPHMLRIFTPTHERWHAAHTNVYAAPPAVLRQSDVVGAPFHNIY